MKSIFILILLASTAVAADLTTVEPMDALKSNGILVISDGSSLYEFHSDGNFHSYPIQYSGRCFDGKWTPDKTTPWGFNAIAVLSWATFPEEKYDYFRINFELSRGSNQPVDILPSRPIQYTNIFKCYFIIRELRPISDQEAQQGGAEYPSQGAGSSDP